MSGMFDPYHRWLGIPPKDQPPNYYRLLGVELFEADREVIRDAAERQMAHVRTYQLGSQSALSQKILNELGAAKACLLDLPKKTAYDASLERTTQQPTKTFALSEGSYSTTSPASVLAPPVVMSPVVKPPVVVPPTGTDNEADVYQIVTAAPAVKQTSRPRAVARPQSAPGSDPKGNKSPRALKASASEPTKWTLAKLLGLGSIIATTVVVFAAILLAGYLNPRSDSENSPISANTGDVSLKETPDSSEPAAVRKPQVRPPKLATMKDQAIDEGGVLRFPVAVADAGAAGASLRFRLEPDAPAGASIDPRTGVFYWKPSFEQLPGEYSITIHAAAEGHEESGDRVTFRVTVRKAPKPPPVIQDIAEQAMLPGDTKEFTVAVTNPNGPADRLVFSLPQSPPWMSIDRSTGTITCRPNETISSGRYGATVRVVREAERTSGRDKSFAIVVLAPSPTTEEPATPQIMPSGEHFIQLPSNITVTLADIRITARVHDEVRTLESQCRTGAPGVMGMFQEGSQTAIAAMSNVKGTKLFGATVLFYPHEYLKPKHYLTYRNNTLHGIAASWNETGQQQYWCNYAGGKREGLCCLLKNDSPIAVLEFGHDKIDSIHLIAHNQISKSFTNEDEAREDGVAKLVLQEVDKLEQRIDSDDRAYRERIKHAVQMGIGLMNQQKRDAFRARSTERKAGQDDLIRGLRKTGGL